MPVTLRNAVQRYFRSRNPAAGTRAEYKTTLSKWSSWGGGVSVEKLGRQEIREFLDWVYDQAVRDSGSNPGRTANKAREHLKAIVSWAWETDLIDSLSRFPRPREQREVAGRHYLTKSELNALYFATHQMKRPRGWQNNLPVGSYWRAAPLAFKAITTIPQPTSFLSLARGHDGMCPCCKRPFLGAS